MVKHKTRKLLFWGITAGWILLLFWAIISLARGKYLLATVTGNVLWVLVSVLLITGFLSVSIMMKRRK